MISVVIPSLLRTTTFKTLEALAAQRFEAADFEVIIVGDGASPDAAARVAERQLPFSMRVVTQPHAGLAAARNRGAALARHDRIVFLDDDMVLEEDLLVAMNSALDAGADVVLASIRIGEWVPSTRYSREGRAWERLPRMNVAEPVRFDEVFFAAAAVRRDLFESNAGFDESFTSPGRYGNEDLDLGLRLSAAGATIRRIPNIVRTDLVTEERVLLHRARQIGRNDVRLARKHPHVAEARLANRASSRSHRAAATAIMHIPALGGLATPLTGVLRLFDVFGQGACAPAHRVWKAARSLRHWQGVAEAGGADLVLSRWDPHRNRAPNRRGG